MVVGTDIGTGTAIGVASGVALMTIGGVMRLWRRDIERAKDVEQLRQDQSRLEKAVEQIPISMEHVADSFRDGFKELHTALRELGDSQRTQGEALAYLKGRAEERDSSKP